MKSIALLIGASLAMSAAMAQAQSFPAKPIRLVVSAAAGGSLDVPARAVAERLREIGRAHV